MSLPGPYLQIELVVTLVRLRDIITDRDIVPGEYDISIEGAWIAVNAVEMRGSSGFRRASRWAELYGSGLAAEKLMLLEMHMKTSVGPIKMRDRSGGLFEIAFKDIESSLFVAGVFLDKDDGLFPCQVMLNKDYNISCYACEATIKINHRRVLSLIDLSFEQRMTLIDSVVAGGDVLIEKIP